MEGDPLVENNFDTLEQLIVSAIDPNIKQCFPEGKVTAGLKKIKYVIHFQNCGNDTAYKVTVVDTITQKLGLRYLKITSTSHPSVYSLKVVNNQALVWEFNNILLPDSNVNEKASHGYIAFEADINGTIAEGDSITNKAYIYFDYQKAVVTNTASVVIIDPSAGSGTIRVWGNEPLIVFPNPAGSFVNVVTAKKYGRVNVLLFNSLGQLVCRERTEGGSAVFNTGKLPKGIYFIRMEDREISVKLLVE
jgi:uncharacterized repeat protein (TIGR01451 family)